MKIIIVYILFTVQAQYIDEQSSTFSLNNDISTINSFTLISQTINESLIDIDKTIFIESSSKNIFDQYNENDINTSTILNHISDVIESTYESQTWSSFFSLSSKTNLESTTLINNILYIKEQWFNVNQSNKDNPYDSSIFWRKIDDNSLDGSTYIIKSDGHCLQRMCHVKLKYNGIFSNITDGCLSFILWTRGQPAGQLWIEEDEEQESFSQKIQLSNSSLRIEHSLRSKIKNLSIDARILFRNSQIDAITLSNLNINWKGTCPKHRLIVTPLPDILVYQSTSEDNLITLASEDFYQLNTLTTNENFENISIESSTIKFDIETNTKHSYSSINQSNIGWILSLIILFCFLIILSSCIYGLWSIQGHYRFTWYVHYDSPIQLLSRRSFRSSTRSENKIATITQLSSDFLHIDSQLEYLDSYSINSSQTTSSAFYTYF